MLLMLTFTLLMIRTPLLASATAEQGKLLLEPYNPDGTAVSISAFVDYTHYIASSKWSMFQNYGIFPIGTPPATSQIGSDIAPANVGGANYIGMTVPADTPFYFTCLWRAPKIGTVFMRADRAGTGYVVAANQSMVLELPYEFALSEFEQVNRMTAGRSLSREATNLLQQAAEAIAVARRALTPPTRASAAYDALALVMPLKERVVLDTSNKAIAATGKRPDFVLNYEGFGSWTDARFATGYARAKQAGFAAVLTACDWKTISPSRDVYNFSALDYAIGQAKSLGFSVALNIDPGPGLMPTWAADLSFNDLRSLYYDTARMVVARYKDKVSWFYPAAELELATSHHSLQELADLAGQALSGARASAPSMPFGIYVSASAYVSYQMNTVPNPNYVSGWDLVASLAKTTTRFDFLGLEMQHGTVFAPIDLQRFQEVLLDYYAAARIPIHIGETGYTSRAEDYGSAAQFFWHSGLTQEAQAEWADGTLRIAYGLPFVTGYYWVHLDPDDNDYGQDFLSTLVGSGLFRSDGAAKKSYGVFQGFTSWFQNQHPVPVERRRTGPRTVSR
jgi:hypothetical protein